MHVRKMFSNTNVRYMIRYYDQHTPHWEQVRKGMPRHVHPDQAGCIQTTLTINETGKNPKNLIWPEPRNEVSQRMIAQIKFRQIKRKLLRLLEFDGGECGQFFQVSVRGQVLFYWDNSERHRKASRSFSWFDWSHQQSSLIVSPSSSWLTS